MFLGVKLKLKCLCGGSWWWFKPWGVNLSTTSVRVMMVSYSIFQYIHYNKQHDVISSPVRLRKKYCGKKGTHHQKHAGCGVLDVVTQKPLINKHYIFSYVGTFSDLSHIPCMTHCFFLAEKNLLF